MIAMWIVLWIISIIIFVTDPKSDSNKSASFILFFLGTGFAAKLFRNFVLPIITDKYPSLLNSALFFNSLLFSFSTYLPSYFLITYSITFSNIIRFKSKSKLLLVKIALLTPIAFMFVFVPYTSPIPIYKTNYILLSIWSIPYMLFSYVLIILAYVKESNKSIKLVKLVNVICIIPAFTAIMYSETIIPMFYDADRNFLYSILIIYLIVCFGFLALKSTFFGIKISLEKNKSIYENRMYNSGISMLNHSIKNEVSKISLCATYLNDYLHVKDETVDIIIESSSHLLEMINKLNIQAREVVLNNEFIRLKDLVNEVVSSNKILFMQKNITCTQNIGEDLGIFCDRVHFRELLNNIIKNSIEAIEDVGNIYIDTHFENRYLVILIKDSGHGILKKDINNITEPFFSTKDSSQNYGIGLYYCKKVIDKHGGFLKIQSKVGSGTEVFVFFPKKSTASKLDEDYIIPLKEEIEMK